MLLHHTTQVYHPKVPFGEAKIYWDAHNSKYRVKNLFAIAANAPHYCLFCLDNTVGSEHDYQDLKHKYTHTLEYLHKTPEEMATSW
jgi:L-lysine 2,3-aminomutase